MGDGWVGGIGDRTYHRTMIMIIGTANQARFSAAAITKQKVEEEEDTKPLYNCLDCVTPGAGQTLRSPLAAAPAKYIGCALGSNGPWHVCI